jgi:hypothetical protein
LPLEALLLAARCWHEIFSPKIESTAALLAASMSLSNGIVMTISKYSNCLVLALGAGLLLSIASSPVHADERCGQLVRLHKQYRGVALSDEQKQLKVQLVAWYKENCGRRLRSARRSAEAGQGQN